MKEITLNIDGKEIKATVSDEELKKLMQEPEWPQKGCEYCDTTQNRYLTDDVYMATTNSYGDKQRILTSNNGVAYKTLGFCPICGKRLEVEHGN